MTSTEKMRAEFEQHGDCDYNTGPGSDQCPHGVFFMPYRCPVCGSDDRVEHNDAMHAQEGEW